MPEIEEPCTPEDPRVLPFLPMLYVAWADGDLTGKEIRAHLDAGKQVRKLGLVWEDRLAFQLDEHLVTRRLRFKEFIDDELERMESEDEAALFDAEFAIMTGELRRLIARLIDAFGGEA